MSRNLLLKGDAISWILISKILVESDYLYFSRNIQIDLTNLNCYIVNGGLVGCNEGAIANILGASLAKKHSRYFGIITEEEFIHDMNTIGNVCYNNSIRLICLSTKKTLIDYCQSL